MTDIIVIGILIIGILLCILTEFVCLDSRISDIQDKLRKILGEDK